MTTMAKLVVVMVEKEKGSGFGDASDSGGGSCGGGDSGGGIAGGGCDSSGRGDKKKSCGELETL
jgi:hypothetical protein